MEQLSADVFARAEIRVRAGRRTRVYTADTMPERVRGRLVQLGQTRESWMKHKHVDPRIYLAPGVDGPATASLSWLKPFVDFACEALRATPSLNPLALLSVAVCDVLCWWIGWGC